MGQAFNQELYNDQKSSIFQTLQNEASKLSPLDKAQLVTDTAGLFDPTPTTGVLSTAISAGRGDLLGVGLGLVGLVPYFGDVAKLGKIAKFAPETADALKGFLKAGDDFSKASADVLKSKFTKDEIAAARRKATEAVRKKMKKKMADPNCKECRDVKKARLPRSKGKWDTPDGKPPTNGTGKFTFDEPKTLPDGTKVDSINYKDGFPDFDPYVQGGKHDITSVTGDAAADSRTLAQETGVTQPQGYTLHHFEDGQVGYVPSVLNNEIPHTGGASIVSGDTY